MANNSVVESEAIGADLASALSWGEGSAPSLPSVDEGLFVRLHQEEELIGVY